MLGTLLALCGGLPAFLLTERPASAKLTSEQIPATCRWTVVQRPDATLTAVASMGNKVWAVGSNAAGAGVVLAFDGGRWSSTELPGEPLADVAAEGTGVWAVAERHALRWTGSTWQRVAVPGLPPATRRPAFAGLDLHRGEPWLVGRYQIPQQGATPSSWLLARRHGGRWQVSSGRVLEAGLTAISVASARHAWAVGTSGPSVAFAQELVLRWNGAGWKELSRYDYVYDLQDVLALGAKDAWAVGATNWDAFPRAQGKPAITRWNGKRWTRVAVPTWRLEAPRLKSLAAFGRRNVWAGGEKFSGRPALLHWDGLRWREDTPPPVRSGVNDLATGAGGTLWAVGEGFVARSRCQ
jgi:hypothetical protein